MRTTAFIGLGMVGGSLARGMIEDGERVLGWDHLPGVRALAARSGIEITSPSEMAEEADLIVLAVPPAETGPLAGDLLRSGARAVTDTASVKTPVFRSLGRLTGEERGRWLGGHPMAGTQRSGWRASDPEIFREMTWAVCSEEQPGTAVLFEVSRLVDVFGGALLPAHPEEHDQAVAVSSHSVQVLQQVLAGGLADRPAQVHRLSGPALRDSTRLAESPLDGMWEEIISSNGPEVSQAMDGLIAELQSARDLIKSGDRAGFRQMWRHGSLGRERLIALRWQERNWRSASLPLGRWWPGLVDLGREGVLIRRPEEESGALLLFEKG